MGIYNGELKASHCKRPCRSDVEILSYLRNEIIGEICIKS